MYWGATTYLNADGQVIFFDALVVQRMVHLNIRPCISVVRSLLQVECVELVRLRCRAGHQAIEHGRIPFNARTKRTRRNRKILRNRMETNEKKYELVLPHVRRRGLTLTSGQPETLCTECIPLIQCTVESQEKV